MRFRRSGGSEAESLSEAGRRAPCCGRPDLRGDMSGNSLPSVGAAAVPSSFNHVPSRPFTPLPAALRLVYALSISLRTKEREGGPGGGKESLLWGVRRPRWVGDSRSCGSRSKCRNTSRVTLIKTQAIFTPRSSEIVQGREGGKSKQELRGNRCPGAKEEGRSHAKPSGNTGERATPH